MNKTEFLTIFATYDALSTIQTTLPSIVEETKRAGAALIVHDSTDGEHSKDVWDWLQELNRENDFFLILSSNLSMAHARNMCLQLGVSMYAPDYVCMMEDDHGFLPGLIPEMIVAMRQYYGKLAPNGLRYGLFTACRTCWAEHKYHETLDGHSYPDAGLPPVYLGGANSCFRCAPASHWNAVLKGYDPDEYPISFFQTSNCNFRNYNNGFTTLVVGNGALISSVQRTGRGVSRESFPPLFDTLYTASDRRSHHLGKPIDPASAPSTVNADAILEPPRQVTISGFSALEHAADGGAWRWALGPESRVFIDTARESEAILDFEFLNPIKGQVVEIACNDSQLAKIHPSKDEWVRQSIAVNLQRGGNNLSFRYADWNGRVTSFSAEDPRPMAVRFTKLNVVSSAPDLAFCDRSG
jgi:hypothetical protein